MALTLLDSLKYFQRFPEDVQPQIIQKYVGSSSLLQVLPFQTILSDTYSYRNQTGLPTVGARFLNGEYPESKAKNNSQKETTLDFGSKVKLDVRMAEMQAANGISGSEALMMETEAHAQANAINYTRMFFKGDSRGASGDFDGLQNRLTGDRVVYAHNSSSSVSSPSYTSGGDALSMDVLRYAKRNTLNPSAWFMSADMKMHFDALASNPDVAGYVTLTPGQIGLEVQSFMGLPIYTLDQDGTNNADGSPNFILPFEESAAGGGDNNCTSIYCVSFGDLSIKGIQQGPIKTVMEGKIPGQEYWQATIKWYAAMVMQGKRDATRIASIKDAAIIRGAA